MLNGRTGSQKPQFLTTKALTPGRSSIVLTPKFAATKNNNRHVFRVAAHPEAHSSSPNPADALLMQQMHISEGCEA